MRRLILSIVAVVCGLSAHPDGPIAVENDESGVERMLRQLEELETDSKLDAEARNAVLQAERFLRARQSGSCVSVRRDSNPTRDYNEFKSSPAYGFLDESERQKLDRMARGQQVDLPRADRSTVYSVPDGLQVGDLVLRREDAFLSRHFVNASSVEKRFSHVGIVMQTSPVPLIVTVGDSIDNSATSLSWSTFFAYASDCAVYRFAGDANIGERIARAAEKRIGIPFDPAFDLKTKDRLYCSELVRDAVNEAVGKPVIGTTKKGTFEYVAIDDCYRSGWTKVFDAKEGK